MPWKKDDPNYLAYQRKWRELNREKIKEQGRKRYADNPEKFRAKALAKYRRNRESSIASSKLWREKRKDYVAEYARKNSARHNYGLSFDEFEALKSRHNGHCAICDGTSKRDLDIDHCHSTGMVRGLLCNRCNRLVSLFENGNQPLIEKVIEYLELYASKKSGSTKAIRSGGTPS